MSFNLIGTQFVHNNQKYDIKEFRKEDLLFLTNMINAAFAMWCHLGRGLQSPETIESYLSNDGFIIHNADTGISCATVCLKEADPKIEGDQICIKRAQRLDEATLFEPAKITRDFKGKKFVYFYCLSVDPSLARSGLGKAILEHCFHIIQSAGYDGMMLETGKETGWLVKWYERLGFQTIGEGILPNTNVRTVMMVKRL